MTYCDRMLRTLGTLLILLPIHALAAVPLTDPPVRFWGQLVDTRPPLVAMVVSADGTTVATCAATVAPENGRTYYSVEWPWQPFSTAVAGAQRPTLVFRSAAGTPDEGRLPLTAGGRPPDRMDLVEGKLVAPQTPFVSLRLRHPPKTQELRMTAVLANRTAAPATGTLLWKAMGGPEGFTATLQLAPGSVTVSELTTTIADGANAPLVWRVDWAPSGGRESHHLARVSAESDQVDVVNHVGTGGQLPATDPLRPTGGRVTLEDIRDDPGLALGQYLAVELETTLDEGAARDALINWGLATGAKAGDKPLRIPLDTLRTSPLPGGGCWLKGDWLVTQAVKAAAIALLATPQTPLPGQWRLRRLSTYWVHEGESSY
jgi:hypothetical protein